MRDPEPSPHYARFFFQFVLGMGYLSVFCAGISEVTRTSFVLTLTVVLIGVVFTATAFLVWLGLRVVRKQDRRGQFSIATMLFLTFLVAAYLGVIRLFAERIAPNLGPHEPPSFELAATICVVLTVVSIPFLVILMDGFVWLAAWIVRRSWVQERLRRLRQKDAQ